MPLAVAFLLFHSAPHVSHHPCSHSSVSTRCRYMSQSMSTSKKDGAGRPYRLPGSQVHATTSLPAPGKAHMWLSRTCLPACLPTSLSDLQYGSNSETYPGRNVLRRRRNRPSNRSSCAHPAARSTCAPHKQARARSEGATASHQTLCCARCAWTCRTVHPDRRRGVFATRRPHSSPPHSRNPP